MRQVGYLQELNRDAWSTKRKILKGRRVSFRRGEVTTVDQLMDNITRQIEVKI